MGSNKFYKSYRDERFRRDFLRKMERKAKQRQLELGLDQ